MALWGDRLAVGAPHYVLLTPDTPRGQPQSFIKAKNAERGDALGCAIASSDRELVVKTTAR